MSVVKSNSKSCYDLKGKSQLKAKIDKAKRAIFIIEEESHCYSHHEHSNESEQMSFEKEKYSREERDQYESSRIYIGSSTSPVTDDNHHSYI